MRKAILFTVLLAAAAVSCAKKEKFDYTEQKREAFDLWMAKYHPEAESMESGIYVEWIERSGSDVRLNDGYWMKLDYTGRLFDGGTIYLTRDAEDAKKGDFYYPAVYYTPQYLQYYPPEIERGYFAELSGLTDGQVEMLGYMAEGDSVRIYMYATEAYNYNFYGRTGYIPSPTLAGRGTSVIVDMKLVDVVPDPLELEAAQVRDYAAGIEGMVETDPGFFLKKTEEHPDADPVGDNTFIHLYYTLRSLDGHIFDTNDKSVAMAAGIFDSSSDSYAPKIFTPDEAELGKEMPAFGKTLLSMRFGERATAVFVSDYGHSLEGNGNLYIPPYTPLIYDMYVPAGFTSE